jgi:hypothetical protein
MAGRVGGIDAFAARDTPRWIGRHGKVLEHAVYQGRDGM